MFINCGLRARRRAGGERQPPAYRLPGVCPSASTAAARAREQLLKIPDKSNEVLLQHAALTLTKLRALNAMVEAHERIELARI
jgi:hypothetical protein